MTEHTKISPSSSNQSSPPITLTFSVPSSLYTGVPSETNDDIVNLTTSGFYLTDTFLLNRLYPEEFHSVGQRIKGITLRLPFVLATTFINHEYGHLKLPPYLSPNSTLKETIYPESGSTEFYFYRASYSAGGLENTMLLSQTIYDDMIEFNPSYSSQLLYLSSKFDYSIQRFLAPALNDFSLTGCLHGDCNGDSIYTGVESDPYELMQNLSLANNETLRAQTRSSSDNFSYTSEDVGYDQKVQYLGTAFQFLDPTFLWSAKQLLWGQPSKMPVGLPQFNYLETPHGPTFIVRDTLPAQNCSLTLGLSTTWNNQSTRENGQGYQIEVKNIPIKGEKAKMDISHQGYLTPEKEYLSEFGVEFDYSLNNQWNLGLSVYQKLGDGYLAGAQYYTSTTPALSLTWNGAEETLGK